VAPWLRVSAAVFAVAWGGNEFTPLLVTYRLDQHLSALTVNLLLGAYVLGIVPALLIGGPLSDRFGRRALALPAPVPSPGPPCSPPAAARPRNCSSAGSSPASHSVS
jgi:MFS family permease